MADKLSTWGREWRVIRVNSDGDVVSVLGEGLHEDFARRLIHRHRHANGAALRLQFRDPPPPRPGWETVSVASDETQQPREDGP